MRQLKGVWAAVLVGSLWVPWAAAREPWHPTPEEFNDLPPYCYARMKLMKENPKDPTVKRWEDLMGSDFGHVHHYCVGLGDIIVAQESLNERAKKEALNAAIGEFDYVLRHGAVDGILRPEVLLKKAQVLIELQRQSEAEPLVMEAVRLKSEWAAPYLVLADLLEQRGDQSAALEVLELGSKRVRSKDALEAKKSALKDRMASQPAGKP